LAAHVRTQARRRDGVGPAMLRQPLDGPHALPGAGPRAGGAQRHTWYAVAPREVEEGARLAAGVAREVHQAHVTQHAPTDEAPPRHLRYLARGLPLLVELVTHVRQLPLFCRVVKFEAGVPGVHVEVDAIDAARALHRERQVIGVDAVAVEVGDEVLLGEADGAARRAALVLPARRHATPPIALVGVDDAVHHERRHVLAEAHDVLGDALIVGPGAEAC